MRQRRHNAQGPRPDGARTARRSDGGAFATVLRAPLSWVVWGLSGLLLGCGPSVSHYVQVERLAGAGDFAAAAAVIAQQRSDYGARNAVLYDLDRGMLLHLAGQYRESNQHLARAEERMDALYTKSVTRAAGAMVTNDNTLPYEGEDFEKVMLNVVAALNYVQLGEPDEALVEIRKVSHKLTLLNERYEKQSRYKDDAFARYLGGILFEARGELNDALVSYRKAYEVYQDYRKQYRTPAPPGLVGDILRVAEALGAQEVLDDFRQRFTDVSWTPYAELRRRAELIIVSYNGLAPVKEDDLVAVPLPDRSGVYPFSVAFPKFVPRPTDLAFAEVHLLADGRSVASRRTSVVEDVTAIGRKNLEDRIGRIAGKAFARATAKYAAARTLQTQARKSDNVAAEILTDLGTKIYGLVSERADTRSWRTLPGEFQLARLEVPPGRYTAVLEYYSGGGALVTRRTVEDIELGAGDKRFLTQRVVGSTPLKRKPQER